MATQPGRDGGITNLVDLPGLGAKFQGRFYGYQQGLSVGEKERLGRGTANWRGVRPLWSAGTLAITGKVRLDAYPIPSNWRGQAGTVRLTHHTGAYEDVPCVVTAAQFSRDEKNEDFHNVSLTARLTASPTWAGFGGTQPGTTSPATSDQEQYVGTSKAVDPQGLASGATRRTDVWGNLTDSDAAELTRLAAIIAAAQAPFAGMKLRSAVFQRDSLDGGEVLETWGLTDTAEDVVNPRTSTTLDPEKLGDAASVATINAQPVTPADDPLFVQRTLTTQELNDAKTLRTATYGRRTTKEDIEFPGTVTGNDPYDLADRAQITRVHDTATAPADPAAPIGELVERATTQIDRGKWQTVYTYANLNSEQRIEFPAASITTDPSALEDVDEQSDVTDSSTVPATPTSRFTDGKLRTVRSTRVGGTPVKWLHVWTFGRRTTQQDIEMPGTVTGNEVSDIDDEATITLVTTSGTAPATPAAPVGQLIKVETTQLHGSDGGRWKHVFSYGNTTALQRIQFPTDVQDADPSLLEDEDHQSDVTATSTPPSTPSPRIAGLVLRSTTSVRIAGTPEKWLHRWTFGRRSTEEDVTFPGTVTTNEVSDIADEATVTRVTTSSTPPTTPAAPVGQLLEIRSEQLTDAGKWKHTFRYGNTTALQRIQFPTDTIETDPSALRDEDRQSQTTADSTVPAAPATRVAGLVLRVVHSQRISGTPEKWLHAWTFGRTTTAEDVTFPGTVTSNEVSDIADDATVTLINSSSTAPATPAAPVGQLLEVRSEQLTDAGKWKHTFKYGNTTALQHIQFPTDFAQTDPAGLADEDHQSSTTSTSTVPTTPAPRISGLVLREISSVRIAGTPEKWLHRWFFGRRSTEEDVTFPGTVTTDEVSDIADDATITRVTSSPTPPATPAAPVGQLLEVRSEQLTDAGKWKHTFRFGNTTALQRIQFPTDVVETDPGALKDEDHQSQTTATSTVPVTPATRVAGLVLRVVTSQRISGTPEKWLHRWDFGRRSTTEEITFPGTVTTDEVSDLRDRATITRVTTSSTPPTTPAAPLGQIITIESEQLTDAGKWRHTFTYGNTTAAQEAAFAATEYADDDKDLTDTDRQSSVGSATPPSDPASRIAGLKLRYRSAKRIGGTPEQWLYTWEFGRRNTQDDVEMPATVTGNDPFDLADTATITKVTNSGTPPSIPAAPIGQHVETETVQIHDTAWRHTFKYANLNSEERLGFPEARLNTDPSALEDEDRQYQITGSSTVPAAPSPRVSDLKLRRVLSRRAGGTPEKWIHVWEFGRRTTAEDITMPGTVTSDEVSNIADEATITLLTTSATPPATPAAPVGQLLAVDTTQVHGSDGGKWKHVFRYGNTTALQKIQFPTDVQDGDPSLLQDEDHQSATTSTSTPPATPAPRISGLVLRATSSVRIAGTPERWLHRWTFGRRSTEEDVTFPGTVTTDEVSDIADDATVTRVTSSSTPPGTPLAPVGQLLEIRSEQLTDSGKWKHTFRFGNTTALQRIQFPTDVLATDPAALRDEDHQSATTSSSTVPSTPAPRVSGLVLRVVTSKRIAGTPEKWLHQWDFGRTSTAEDVTFPGTVKQDDVGDLADRATVTIINNSSTPPTTPSAPLGQLTETRSEQLTDAGKWKHTFTFENTTSVQRVQFPNDKPDDDPQNLEDTDYQSQVTTSITPPAAPATRITGLKLRSVSSQRVGGTPAQYLHVWRFGRRNTQEDVEFPATITDTDQYSIDGEATIRRVTSGSTPPATPAAPLGECVSIATVQIHAGSDGEKWQHTFKYAQVNSQQRHTFPENVAVEDPSFLRDTETQAVIDSSSVPPSDPSPTIGALVLRFRRTRRVSGTPPFYLHVWEFGRRTTEQDITLPGTVTTNEVSDVADEATITLVTSSGTPPVTPAAPVGQLLETRSEELTDAGRWQHTFRYGNTTALQKLQFPTDTLQTDPSLLEDEDQQSDVTSSSTPPATPATRVSGLVLRWISSVRIAGTPEKWLHRWRFGRRTTAEDITLPGTVTGDDVSDLRDQATITRISTSSTPPTTPTAPVGQLVEIKSEQLTDAGRWKHVFRYANNTAEQDVTFPGNVIETDPSSLTDTDRQRQLTGSSTLPSDPAPRVLGLVLRRRNSRRLGGTPEKWLHEWEFGRRSTKSDVEMPATITRNDPSSLDDTATVTLVTVSGTPPSIPASPDADAVHVGTDTEQLNAAAWRHTFRYGPRTSQQAVEMDGTVTTDDPSNLQDDGTITSVTTSATPPTIPAAPAGTVHRMTRSRQLKSGKWSHTFLYGERSTEQDVTLPGTFTDADAYDLFDKAEITIVQASDSVGSPPAAPTDNIKWIRSSIRQLTTDKWAITFHYGPRSSVDEITMDGSRNVDDPKDLADSAEITVVTTSSTPAAAPAAPVTGTKHAGTTTKQVRDGEWQHTYRYARTDTEDEVELPNSWTNFDGSSIRSHGVETAVFTTISGAPAASTPAGLQEVFSRITQLNGTKSKVDYEFRVNTTQQDLEFPETRTFADPTNLESRASVAAVDSTPATPAGYVERLTRSVKVTPTHTLYVKEAGLRSAKDEIEFPGTFRITDPSGLRDRGQQTKVYPTGTPLVDADATIPSGLQIVGKRTEKLTSDSVTTPQSKQLWDFGINTSQQELEFGDTRAVATPLDRYTRATASVATVTASDTAAALADAIAGNVTYKSDPLFDGVEVRKLTATRAIEIIRTSGDDKVLRGAASHTYEDAILGRPPNSTWGTDASYGAPACVVHVVRLPGQIVGGPGGFLKGLVQPIKIWRHRAVYHYRRRIVTADPTAAIQAALIGKTNNAAFLGFGPHFLMMGPPIVHYCYAITGAHLLLIDYVMNYDSQRWLTDENLADGWLSVRSTSILLTNTGYVDPTVYFDPGMTLTWPADVDMTPITL